MVSPRGVRRSTFVTWPRRAIIFLIELYRTWVSPMRLPTCRFEPTCSTYAVEALTEYGAVRGGLLSLVRLAKCGPWHKPGYDPIPERRNADDEHTCRQQPAELDPNAAKEPDLVVTVRN
ncbi:MAG: membrane protein insertion efficiency factor YidD [Gordonia sp.]|nr:membrane protein insertion efficiency factor YidD [Gordonia sp. (in: high G+C Gram-positive bacteria)]